jgi:hypothetical protein
MSQYQEQTGSVHACDTCDRVTVAMLHWYTDVKCYMKIPGPPDPVFRHHLFTDWSFGKGLGPGEVQDRDVTVQGLLKIHANARLWLPAFYSASKTLKQKPHTHVFPSHMVVIVYIPQGSAAAA